MKILVSLLNLKAKATSLGFTRVRRQNSWLTHFLGFSEDYYIMIFLGPTVLGTRHRAEDAFMLESPIRAVPMYTCVCNIICISLVRGFFLVCLGLRDGLGVVLGNGRHNNVYPTMDFGDQLA